MVEIDRLYRGIIEFIGYKFSFDRNKRNTCIAYYRVQRVHFISNFNYEFQLKYFDSMYGQTQYPVTKLLSLSHDVPFASPASLSNTINHSRIPNNRATATSHRRKREKETRSRTTGTSSPRKCNTIRCLATTWRPAGVTSWFRKSGAGGGYTQISRYIWTSWTGYVCECTWPGDTTLLCISTGNFATMHRTWITAEDR